VDDGDVTSGLTRVNSGNAGYMPLAGKGARTICKAEEMNSVRADGDRDSLLVLQADRPKSSVSPGAGRTFQI